MKIYVAQEDKDFLDKILQGIIMNSWSYTSTPKYVFMAWCIV